MSMKPDDIVALLSESHEQQELNELIDICDRIVVFKRGRISQEFMKGQEDITPKRLIAAIEGVSMEEEHEHV